MALTVRDTPVVEYGVVQIFDDDDDGSMLTIRNGETMYECKKLTIAAKNALVLSSPAELSEAHAQGNLKDSAKAGRHLAVDLLANHKLLSCISVISTGKENYEVFLHLTTTLDSTEKERSRNLLDCRLLRPLTLATLKAIRDNADLYEALDDASMKHLGRAFKLIPDEVKKGDVLHFRAAVVEGSAYNKMDIPWRKYQTNARQTTVGEKRKAEEELNVKNKMLTIVDVPGAKGYILHVSENATVTKQPCGNLLICDYTES